MYNLKIIKLNITMKLNLNNIFFINLEVLSGGALASV